MDFNPHPPLSAFPIALACLVALCEVVSYFWKEKSSELRTVGKWVLVSSFIFSPLTYYTGYWGAELASKTFEVSDELISYHQMLAKLYLATLVTCALFALMDTFDKENRPFVKFGYSTLVALTLFAAIMVSRQGGKLVFEHGAGVSAPVPGKDSAGVSAPVPGKNSAGVSTPVP